MTTAALATQPLEFDWTRRSRALLRGWLYSVLLLLFALVLIGGATRLTDSGLSITEWKPIHGVIPPLSEPAWQEEFAKYRRTPEYRQMNVGMTMEAFKSIFWWEWAHRFIARLVGVAFAVPLAFFWLTGRVERQLRPRLLGLLALGGLQGAVGWWMVASGLVDRVDVSQVRLAVHLTLASGIFVATMAVARGLAAHSSPPADLATSRFAGLLVLLVLGQIFLGGLVAGLDAGMSYNTWPLMDGALLPDGLLVIKPAWLNVIDNPKTVQWLHRLGAYLVLAAALWHAIATTGRLPGTTHARRSLVLLLLVGVQAAVGVATLLTQVDVHLALTHQAMGLIVLGFAAAHWRGCRGAYPRERPSNSTRSVPAQHQVQVLHRRA